MAVDYITGARKTSSPMAGENKNLTYITRNDKKIQYMIEPFAFAPNAERALCYGFGLGGPADIGPPFKIMANATHDPSLTTTTIGGVAVAVDHWTQKVAYKYGDPHSDDGSHDICIVTEFFLKKGTATPVQIRYRYVDIGSRSDFKYNSNYVNGTYTYTDFDSAAVKASDFDVPADIRCDNFLDNSTSNFAVALAAEARRGGSAGAMPDPAATARSLEWISAPARVRKLNAALAATDATWRAATYDNDKPAGVGDYFARRSLAAHSRTLLHHVAAPKYVRSTRGDARVGRVQEDFDSLPEAFDARTAWPRCKGTSTIAQQGNCGSCFAWSASESFQDRLCIKTAGKTDEPMSKMWILACDNTTAKHPNGGCTGGEMDNVWLWIAENGMVEESCVPSGASVNGQVDPCPSTCKDGSPLAKKMHKALPGSAYSPVTDVAKAADQIRADVYKNGPIEVGMWEFDGFQSYKEGIYVRPQSSTTMMGGHAVLIVGWGVENQVPYWTVQNSYGASWGEKGFFRIRRGTNEAGIEDQATAAELA